MSLSTSGSIATPSATRTIAWTLWFVTSIFYAYQFILRVMPSIMMTDIMHQFQIDAATFGQFSGVYYLGYALMHLPIGMMLDRFGPRRVMTGCILLTVVGLLPILLASQWEYPIIGRILIGTGSSAAILGAFKIIRLMFDEARFTRMLSMTVTIGLLGAIYGGGPVNYMCNMLGYHAVVQIMAALGVVLAILTYLIVPNIKETHTTAIQADLIEVFSNRRVVLSCIFAGLMVGPMEGFADVWGTEFLKTVYGFDGTLAASLPSMIFFGMCFAPLLSLIAEKTRSTQGTIVGAGTVMAAGFTLLLASTLSSALLGTTFWIIGVCCAYQILVIYQASTYVRPHVAGLTTAVANMIIMTFGYGFHAVIGAVVDAMGGTLSPRALQTGIAVIPIALTLGALGLATLWMRGSSRHTQTASSRQGAVR